MKISIISFCFFGILGANAIDKNARENDFGIMWNELHCVDESPLLPSQFCDGRSDCSDADNIGTYIPNYYEIKKKQYFICISLLFWIMYPTTLLGAVSKRDNIVLKQMRNFVQNPILEITK